MGDAISVHLTPDPPFTGVCLQLFRAGAPMLNEVEQQVELIAAGACPKGKNRLSCWGNLDREVRFLEVVSLGRHTLPSQRVELI